MADKSIRIVYDPASPQHVRVYGLGECVCGQDDIAAFGGGRILIVCDKHDGQLIPFTITDSRRQVVSAIG